MQPQLGYFRRRGCYTTINTYMMEMQVIQNKIYEIRGIKVMLDFDLAEMYQVETKVLKQAVKRNIQRFPVDFMFELTKPEYDFLRSQIVTLENHTLPAGRGKYSKYLPFAFTEQGIAMLSSVLRNETAFIAAPPALSCHPRPTTIPWRRLCLTAPAKAPNQRPGCPRRCP